MNSKFFKIILLFYLAFTAGMVVMYVMSSKESREKNNIIKPSTAIPIKAKADITELTSEKVVIDYVKKNKKLPNYYITKAEAVQKGWIPSRGNLCDVLPGRAIGGDHFGNREGKLPKQQGRKYFEADVNYSCGRREADRLVFSDDGLVFISKNHYKTFEEK
ncbi:ribonuclease [Elizabethkingia argentiflava]|uniref:Ribonuclease n=1 Tax=Elizabethkingia argenteiflava TaxID=2681556 RepID=A0A845PW86_9FLAO|nr:ribonuclease domain-containing protein [Elizabethkingia argenteiflava]NAW51433.1 ribonuclease [Elizabethkingia argenteiflava]